MKRYWIFLTLTLMVFLVSCSKKEGDSNGVSPTVDTAADQIGDVMASIDEAGGSSGAFSLMMHESKTFASLTSKWPHKVRWPRLMLSEASAASCFIANTWGSCTNNRIVRTFNNCTVGGATFSGTVTLDYDDGNVNNICTVDSDGDTISRSPDFSITGAQGAAYAVTKTGTYGQRVTRTSAGVFTFTNDGIRRTLTYGGSTLANYTTATSAPIGITGTARSGRVANGGSLVVTNVLTNVACTFTPSNLAWINTCNCPVSGTWTATCTDGKTGSLAITSCGAGSFVLGGSSQIVSFDRCSSL